jgi:hypothetical protein
LVVNPKPEIALLLLLLALVMVAAATLLRVLVTLLRREDRTKLVDGFSTGLEHGAIYGIFCISRYYSIE